MIRKDKQSILADKLIRNEQEEIRRFHTFLAKRGHDYSYTLEKLGLTFTLYFSDVETMNQVYDILKGSKWDDKYEIILKIRQIRSS